MNLSPRVKTQYPRTQDIVENESIPVPIETVFFLEDGKQDPYQPNRYYFDYPGNWVTSNNGENIIGLRSIKLRRNPLMLNFIMKMIKYKQEDYEKNYENNYDFTINKLIENKMVIDINLNVNCCIKPDDFNFDSFFKAIHETLKSYIKNYHAEGFEQDESVGFDKDIDFEEFYDKEGCRLLLYCQRNYNAWEKDKLSYKITGANANFIELFKSFKIHKTWQEEILLYSIWDLRPCNVYSSIAEQSLHHYIGTTDTDYPEIKYFKLNSSDQKFWVEFHSTDRYKAPVCFPKNVSFAIELQFQSFNKRLNG